MNKIEHLIDFFLELDGLKHVERRTSLYQKPRLENSAEHSWHLAMACWAVADYYQLDVCQTTLLKLALVHDLGEIDAGDTFLYDAQRSDAHNAEREGVKRLANHVGNPISELYTCWEAQESGDSAEAKLVKAIDRLLPFLYNLKTAGYSWQENHVKRSQVEQAHAFIADDFPEIHAWMREQLLMAVDKGWLLND